MRQQDNCTDIGRLNAVAETSSGRVNIQVSRDQVNVSNKVNISSHGEKYSQRINSFPFLLSFIYSCYFKTDRQNKFNSRWFCAH